MPLSPADIKYLTPEQVRAVIRAARTRRDRAMLAVMYNCGLRRSEVQLLTRDCFMRRKGTSGVLKVTRLKKDGHYVQEIPLWRRTSRLLRRYLRRRPDSNDALFLSRKGGPVTGQCAYYVYKKAASRARIPEDRVGKTHAMRHSIATHMIGMGLDLADVQNLLAHDDLNSTIVYARMTNPRMTRNALLMETSHHVAKF
jgi:integrase/recombinase XerD